MYLAFKQIQIMVCFGMDCDETQIRNTFLAIQILKPKNITISEGSSKAAKLLGAICFKSYHYFFHCIVCHIFSLLSTQVCNTIIICIYTQTIITASTTLLQLKIGDSQLHSIVRGWKDIPGTIQIWWVSCGVVWRL